MTAPRYDRHYFERIAALSLESARIVAPTILSLIQPIPKAVVDVGCGAGVWLSAFQRLGVERIRGLDGAAVTPCLRINRHAFTAVDLSKPFSLDETFDLALCLEVAEHLPARAAKGLVESLSRLAPLVVFSAAVPCQGGTHHLNEQWPDYWEHLFSQQAFVMLDPIRPLIWQDNRVCDFYRQNMFLFARQDAAARSPTLSRYAELRRRNPLTLIHGDVLKRQLQFRSSVRRLPGLLWRGLGRRLGRLDNRLPA